MIPPNARLSVAAALLCMVTALPAGNVAAEAGRPVWTLGGDLRLRFERDWDSQTGAGAARPDRDRVRVRARGNLSGQLNAQWSLGVRARTGNRDSQQSPHLTVHSSDGLTDDPAVSLDRYFLQFWQGAVTAWAGRNTTPFWQQNELFWDEDVTPTGVAVSHEAKFAAGTVTSTAGAFRLPDGLTALHGTLVGAQLRLARRLPSGRLTLASGLYQLDGRGGAAFLRNRNGARDYLLGVLNAQWTHAPASGRALVLGADWVGNFEDYTAADALPFAARHADETHGWVLSALYGSTRNPGDWQAGWFYARIGTLAVNAAYAQDDWARFGSATQSDLTDLKGHEFRGTYMLTKSLTVQARLFLVQAIRSIQDGKRFRLDLNWRF